VIFRKKNSNDVVSELEMYFGYSKKSLDLRLFLKITENNRN